MEIRYESGEREGERGMKGLDKEGEKERDREREMERRRDR